MRVKNRLSPYPILDDYGDDYINSSFTAEYDVKHQFAELCGKIVFHLQNREIENLIEEARAEYTVHIECPSTSYRKKISSVNPEIEFRLDSRHLSKTVEMRTFIVLTQNISGFSSENFHPDYSGQKFDLLAHQILAVGTAKDYHVNQDDRDLESLPSVLQIVKLSNKKKGSLNVSTDSDNHVMVGLAPEVYDWYARLGKSMFKDTAFSLVLFPALVVILQRMVENKDDEDVNARHWFQVINRMLENNGCKLDNISVENDSLLKTCQQIFADPIARSFKELDLYSERM